MIFPQLFPVISAYKDPVENQNMRKIPDKIITGFFVLIFGILWYCSSRYYVKSEGWNVIIYDVFGNQIKSDSIRTNFQTIQVARSHISEYKKRFPHFDFVIAAETPEIEKNTVLRNC